MKNENAFRTIVPCIPLCIEYYGVYRAIDSTFSLTVLDFELFFTTTSSVERTERAGPIQGRARRFRASLYSGCLDIFRFDLHRVRLRVWIFCLMARITYYFYPITVRIIYNL